jgi:ribosomal protein L7/L12
MTGKQKLIYALVAILVVATVVYAWQRVTDAEERHRQAVTLSEQQMQNAAIIKQELSVTKQNAQMLKEAYEREKNKPAETFYVQAPSVPAAAEQVEKQIKNKDPALPEAALENTDRTVVVPNLKDQKVDVLKINLDKSWELSTGVGVHRGDAYIPIGFQRNVGKSGAWEVEVHLSSVRDQDESLISGGEVKRVWRF